MSLLTYEQPLGPGWKTCYMYMYNNHSSWFQVTQILKLAGCFSIIWEKANQLHMLKFVELSHEIDSCWPMLSDPVQSDR